VNPVKLADDLYHWLQIRLVADRRPDDEAARHTVEFFVQLLAEEHGVDPSRLTYDVEETVIHVRYVQHGQQKRHMFSREAAELLLRHIENEPRYGQ